MQRLQREGGVAHPGVAVVPVALAARRLGQRGGEGRHRGPGRHVGHALDRQGRALDRVPEAVVGHARPPQPGAPEAHGGRDPALGVGHVPRRRQPALPGQGAVGALAGPQHVPRPDGAPLDAEGEVRAQADRLARPAGVGRVAVALDQRPLGRRASVVEDRLADEVDLDLALEALDGAHQQVLGVVVGRRAGVGRDEVLRVAGAHRQRVAHDHPPRGGLPGRDHHVGARLVGARRRGG